MKRKNNTVILIHQEEKDLIHDLNNLGLEVVPADLRDEKGGDLRWFAYTGEEIGAEVKQFPSGLLVDIRTERLTDQLVRMKDGFDIRLLFIKDFPDISERGKIILSYWHYRNGRKELVRQETGWHWNAVMLYLFSSYWCLGIIPLWCPKGTLAESVKTIYEWTQKPEEHGKWIKRLSKTTIINKPDLLVEILSKFPDMGEKTSKDVLKQERTLWNTFHLAVEDPKKLQKVKGVGKKRSEYIKQVLLREYKEDGNNS